MTVTKKSHFFLVLSPKAHFKKENKCNQNQKNKIKLHKVYHSKEGHRKNCSRDLIEQINRSQKRNINLFCCDVSGSFSLPGISQKRRFRKLAYHSAFFFIPFPIYMATALESFTMEK